MFFVTQSGALVPPLMQSVAAKVPALGYVTVGEATGLEVGLPPGKLQLKVDAPVDVLT